MITKEKKREIVAELLEKLEDVQGLYLLDFSGITADESIELRRAFRSAGSEFKVAKNTLIKRALDEKGSYDIPADVFIGQTGLAFGIDDAVAPARIIKKFADRTKKLKLKAAVVEGQNFSGDQLSVVASLPTREDLIAGILGSLNSPASGIVGAINSVMRDLASVIEESAKQRAGA